ncbi:MAG: V-type ATP synthase subunit I [Clostridiales bacterium]|jgi:V/A-type H+-transporting ATPase subunit I|nr:V-type ATP synthase subunit I [Clostridiales bacterium]MCI1962171.1 V-type ATP synthase subunit I [Clostridiales bacterium]MCI2022613.1 V-type ATP synthase subunit I [Clostridiales bacterium]MCI2027072.1 V-type ATP synthase subunit I [Clostridiales bacterium]
MAVVQMRRINLLGLRKNRKQTLELLQRRGVVEITPLNKEEDHIFHRMDVSSSKTQFQQMQQSASQALGTLDSYVPRKTSPLSALEGRKAITLKEYHTLERKREKIIEIVTAINTYEKEIHEKNAAKLKLQMQLETLHPWLSLDVPLQFCGTQKTSAFIGTMPGGVTNKMIEEAFAKALPENGIYTQIIDSTAEQTCVFLLVNRSICEKSEELLRSLGFARPTNLCESPPKEEAKRLEEKIQRADKEISAAQDGIASYADKRDEITFLVDYFSMREEKYQVLGTLIQSRRTFLLTGYVPTENAEKLSKELYETCGVAVEVENLSDQEEAPVLLKNNNFTSPMESVVESFSLPGKGEIDPSSIIAFFFYFFFGMMLSDAGYGLLMVIACGIILKKYQNMEPNLRKSIRMFFFCGISTMVWGILFGGFFGDAIQKISSTFFGHEISIPALWFTPTNNPMRLLMFCLGIGIFHLFLGVAVKGFQDWKQGAHLDVIYDVVFIYLFVGGLLLLLFTTSLFQNMANVKWDFSPMVAQVATWITIIGAVGIVATSGRESRNPVKRILKGIFALYNNATGYLSDILSYSRLLALGLATGIIANVVNQMGTMAGGGIGGAILFIVVFLLGHTMNIGINMLGAYVHTVRLQYVEFFGKFYEGGGTKFHPFGIHTKFFKFRED